MGHNTLTGDSTINVLILTGKVLDKSYIYYFCPESHLHKYSVGLGPIIPNAIEQGVPGSIMLNGDGEPGTVIVPNANVERAQDAIIPNADREGV